MSDNIVEIGEIDSPDGYFFAKKSALIAVTYQYGSLMIHTHSNCFCYTTSDMDLVDYVKAIVQENANNDITNLP